MKLVALVAFRNEAWCLETLMSSLKGNVNLVIGLDDGSTDSSAEIFQDYGGMRLTSDTVRPYSQGGEYDFRTLLLAKGRSVGGTHFICLDADEAISCHWGESARSAVAELRPGEALEMQWATLWGSLSDRRVDSGPWFPGYKDFVFCDEPSLKYESGLMHLPRTPVGDHARKYLSPEDGVILHYQFADHQRVAVKQAWYRCIEWINETATARRINMKYSHEWLDKDQQVQSIPEEWSRCLVVPNPVFDPQDDWRYLEVVAWFAKYGIEFFEKLDIWRVQGFLESFRLITGREPKPALTGLRTLGKFRNSVRSLRT